ncbi:MAG: GatB/YqeY domain-containing protein [Desulfobulbaceae bacterium]|nr:GatB/YqeY domain-containing protein [Desulfobulbaceae bacterium]
MLRNKINEAMKDALRAKDERALSTTRMILAKLKDLDIAARPKGITDGISEPEISAMLQGMVKQRRESIVLYEKGNRPDLAKQESEEIAVIERFLPQQMGETEAKAAIAKAIADVGAKDIKDMGKVMGELKKSYTGQMDFSLAGPMVKSALGG